MVKLNQKCIADTVHSWKQTEMDENEDEPDIKALWHFKKEEYPEEDIRDVGGSSANGAPGEKVRLEDFR